MTRRAVSIDGTDVEGHIDQVLHTGDLVVDVGTHTVVVGPEAVSPISDGAQGRRPCPECHGRGTIDGVACCGRCGGDGTIVRRAPARARCIRP